MSTGSEPSRKDAAAVSESRSKAEPDTSPSRVKLSKEDRETTFFYGDGDAHFRQDVLALRAPPLTCWGCNKAPGGPMAQCGKCGLARYCHVSCQRDDWKKAHKRLCNGLLRDRKESESTKTSMTAKYNANPIRAWILVASELIFHLAAETLEHRLSLAEQLHTIIVVHPASEPELMVRIVAIYRVDMARDPDAFTDIYDFDGRKTQLSPTDKMHRIFVFDIDRNVSHAVQMPYERVNLRLDDPLNFDLLVRFAEFGMTQIAHTGVSLGGRGLMPGDTFPEVKRPNETGIGMYNGKMGIFERKDGKCRFSPSPKTPFSTAERKWIDVPADAF